MKPTKNGYDFYEVLSSLQKEVRRGNEENALHWAFELLETNTFMLEKRLRTIIYEDIGVADKAACIFSLMALNDFNKEIENKQSGTLILSNIILALCRAKKTRDAGNINSIVRMKRKELKIEVPDYALDRHTLRGKRMGRDIDFFYKEGDKLSNDHSNKEYRERAKEIWKKVEKENLNLRLEPNSLNKVVPKGQKKLFEED
jgi:replication-associated recombination protein RarA